MQTGWQKINGSWYYLGPVGNGAMRKNQWVDDSYLGSDGKMMTACWVDDYYVGISGKITKISGCRTIMQERMEKTEKSVDR